MHRLWDSQLLKKRKPGLHALCNVEPEELRGLLEHLGELLLVHAPPRQVLNSLCRGRLWRALQDARVPAHGLAELLPRQVEARVVPREALPENVLGNLEDLPLGVLTRELHPR